MTAPPPRLRIVVVDDHALVRTGVATALAERVDVVAEASDVGEAVLQILRVRPDLVLLDVHLPSGGGDQVIREVLAKASDVKFLALSVSDAPDDVIRVIRAGARGYVTKSIAADDLVDAIERVASGDAVFSARLAGFVLDAFAGSPLPVASGSSLGVQGERDLDALSPREREVLQLIARGYTYREAASELYLSVKTIESHVSAVLRKLQLSNRRELSRWANDHRLL